MLPILNCTAGLGGGGPIGKGAPSGSGGAGGEPPCRDPPGWEGPYEAMVGCCTASCSIAAYNLRLSIEHSCA